MSHSHKIAAFPSSSFAYLKEITAYTQLIRFFIWRDIIVRYKQAWLGVAWILLKPLFTMLLFAFIFGLIARFPSNEVNYGLFVLAGMLPWQYFANNALDSCSSLIQNSHLITKAYFPRIILPLSVSTALATDFGISLLFFLGLTPFLGEIPSLNKLLLVPCLVLWTYLLCLGSGVWLAALTARYRDIRFLTAFIVQFGIFISPVGYGTFMIPASWVPLYAMNPLVGLIDAFRWIFFNQTHDWIGLTIVISLCITAILAIAGLMYFRKTEIYLVDML